MVGSPHNPVRHTTNVINEVIMRSSLFNIDLFARNDKITYAQILYKHFGIILVHFGDSLHLYKLLKINRKNGELTKFLLVLCFGRKNAQEG